MAGAAAEEEEEKEPGRLTASSVSVVEDRGRRRPEVGFLWGLSLPNPFFLLGV